VGAEHYTQPWHAWACAASPVVHPVTRRIVGAVNVACRAQDANHLLQVVLRSLVNGVQTALRDAASTRERRLVDAHLRHRSVPGPVVALDRQTLIVNDSAASLNLDRATLWAAVQEAGPTARQVPVTAELVALPHPVTPGRLDDGVVLLLRQRPAGASAPGGQHDESAASMGPLEMAERQVIVDTLAACNGNKSEVAERLGISRGTLYQRLRRYRLA
jgi:transcriptional regulator of acetoin/glycerol metabolism